SPTSPFSNVEGGGLSGAVASIGAPWHAIPSTLAVPTGQGPTAVRLRAEQAIPLAEMTNAHSRRDEWPTSEARLQREREQPRGTQQRIGLRVGDAHVQAGPRPQQLGRGGQRDALAHPHLRSQAGR